MSEIWSRLGIASTNDVTAIRRAYSRALKEIDTEADPASFIALREAYEQALTEAREMAEPVLAGVERDLADAEPVPAPPLREPERVLPQMELDEAPILLIQSMLFGDEPLDEAELESATRRLLADPAMDQVDLARNIEGFLAEVITRSSPRSDAMIDPCIAHFRWHQGVGDIGRPPILDWILQRQQDRAFEDQIQETNPQDFGRMLERLRRPPEEMRALTSWWQAPQIEYFLAYCQQAHPTTIEGLDGDGLQFWEARFADVRNATGVKGWVGRSRYKHVWEQRNGKIVRTAKAIGAYLLPIVGIVLFAQFVHPTNPPAQTRPFTVPAAITERPEVELRPPA